MDVRGARRAAIRTARDLIASRAAAVGELGARRAEQTQLEQGVVGADERGQQLLAAARTQAEQLVAAARALATEGTERYQEAYETALRAGWTQADLSAMDFFIPLDLGAKKRRRGRLPRSAEVPGDAKQTAAT